MSKETAIAERDKVFSELQNLKLESEKLDAKIKAKTAELKRICPCNQREGFGVAICIHCNEHH